MRLIRSRTARLATRLALAFSLAGVLSACQMSLYEGLEQQEANQMVAALISAGVPAERIAGENGAFAVAIDEADMPRAMAALEREGLPSRSFETLGEVFKKEGLLSSPTEERARLVYATSQELSRTINEIDGVLSARIHVVLPEDSGRGQTASSGSASVFVRHKADADIEALMPDIKMLVTRSIANLAYDQVSVIRVAAPATEAGAAMPSLDRAFGVWVLDADAGRLRLMLAALVGLLALALAGHGAWLWAWRQGRLEGRGDSVGAPRLEAVAQNGPEPTPLAPRRPRRVA